MLSWMSEVDWGKGNSGGILRHPINGRVMIEREVDHKEANNEEERRGCPEVS